MNYQDKETYSSEKNRWILITGGSKGIGQNLVRRLSERYEIVFTYLSSADAASSIECALTKQGRNVTAYHCDGREPGQVETLCTNLITKKGAPYALINNMGIAMDESMLSLEVSNYRNTVATNLDSAIFFSKFMSSAMVEHGGTILFMSSVAGVKGNAGQVSYSATKAAMIGAARSLALELARFGVTVNCLAPGMINTEMMNDVPTNVLAKIKKSIPMRRFGEAKEVAALAEFLLSDNARYITGQTFVIDGGLSI
jgi:3-oxoacyl-[acyl-carrier protein] reductase